MALWQRAPSPAELAALAELGRVSQGTRMQAMATTARGRRTGRVEGGRRSLAALRHRDTRRRQDGGRAARGAGMGRARRRGPPRHRRRATRFSIGTATLTVGGIIGDEPDRLGEGFQLGPTVIVREGVPAAAGLTAPGAMYRTKTRVAFAAATDAEVAGDALTARFPNAGFEVRTRDNGAPGADRFVGRMGDFLTLVGLAALVIAGIGIGGGVASYLDARRQGIATLKVLGATSGDIMRIYAIEIGAAALVGSLAGIAAGVAITPLLAKALAGLLPVGSGIGFAPGPLAAALGYGLLVALVFAAPPLMRARSFPAMALMRERVSPLSRDRTAWIPVVGGLAAIVALALGTAKSPMLTGGFLAGAAGALALLAAVGWAIRKGAARLPRPRDPLWRAALANLHRPGAATGMLVTALGFGLSAFVLLAAVQTSIDGTIARRVPAQAPDYFVLDLPKDRVAEFGALVEREAPGAEIRAIPALRGAILAYGPKDRMTRVASLGKDLPDGAWALRGERGLTYAEAVPPGNTLTAGEWWPKDYARRTAGLGGRGPGRGGRPESRRLSHHRRARGRAAGTDRLAAADRLADDGLQLRARVQPEHAVDAPHNMAATIELPDKAPGTTQARCCAISCARSLRPA